MGDYGGSIGPMGIGGGKTDIPTFGVQQMPQGFQSGAMPPMSQNMQLMPGMGGAQAPGGGRFMGGLASNFQPMPQGGGSGMGGGGGLPQFLQMLGGFGGGGGMPMIMPQMGGGMPPPR
jgi:hypothetical protein